MTYFNRSNQYYLGRLVTQQTPVPVAETGIVPVGTPEEGDTLRYSEFTREWTPEPEPAPSTGGTLTPMADTQFLLRKIGSGLGDPEAGSPDDASLILDLATDPFLRTSALLDTSPQFITYTGGSVVNSTITPANIDASANMNIPGAGLYEFEFLIGYNSAAGGTGIMLDLGGSTCPQSYLTYTVFGDTGTGDKSTQQWSSYSTNAPFTSSRALTGLSGIIQGTINATAAGIIRIRFRSELAGSAITITNVSGYFRRLA